MKKIILIGGGGHCKSCIDVIESIKTFKIIGIIDKKENIGKKVLDYKIIGTDEDILTLSHKTDYFLITIGQIGTSSKREKIYNYLIENNLKTTCIISPFSVVSKNAIIEPGTIVMHHAVINSSAKIGKCSIINTKALIEHETQIGDFCHISTGAIINGGVVVEKNCFIGSNSTVNLGTRIHEKTIIASSSLVTKSINKSGVYKGVPVSVF